MFLPATLPKVRNHLWLEFKWDRRSTCNFYFNAGSRKQGLENIQSSGVTSAPTAAGVSGSVQTWSAIKTIREVTPWSSQIPIREQHSRQNHKYLSTRLKLSASDEGTINHCQKDMAQTLCYHRPITCKTEGAQSQETHAPREREGEREGEREREREREREEAAGYLSTNSIKGTNCIWMLYSLSGPWSP